VGLLILICLLLSCALGFLAGMQLAWIPLILVSAVVVGARSLDAPGGERAFFVSTAMMAFSGFVLIGLAVSWVRGPDAEEFAQALLAFLLRRP
jgi:hypothetical protein